MECMTSWRASRASGPCGRLAQMKPVATADGQTATMALTTEGTIAGILETGIGIGQVFERALQIAGASRDLALEQDRRLEQSEAAAGEIGRALDAAHQGAVDLLELAQALIY